MCILNAISQKAINPVELATLQNDVVQCLVSFELVFPPSFYNIMTHPFGIQSFFICGHLVSHLSKFDQVKFGQMKKQRFGGLQKF